MLENKIYEETKFSIIAAPMVRDYKDGKQNFEDVCKMVSSVGIKYMDLMEPEVEEYGLSNVKEQMEKYDLQSSCFISFISMTIMVKEKIHDRIRRALKMANELDCKLFMVVLLPQNDVEKFQKIDRDILLHNVIEYLRWTVEEAKKYSIKVCIEETPNYKLPVCSADDCLKILKNVHGLGCVFDTGNMIPAGEEPVEFYKKVKDYICHVHLKDIRYTNESGWDECRDGRYITGCMYGEGIIPVAQLKDQLVQDGYTGCCAIEYIEPEKLGKNANEMQLKKMIKYLRDM